MAHECRTMNPAERIIPQQELLAVWHAMKIWRSYLEGVKCSVITDHKPDTFLLTQAKELSRRKARWQEYLSRFDIEWIYKPGRTNVADPHAYSDAGCHSYTARWCELCARRC